MLRRINLEYSPLDFFSGAAPRVVTGLRALLQNPQNFCQLFVEGRPVYGRGRENPATARDAIGRLLCLPSLDDPFDALAEVLGQLLFQEPLLARLWALQAMDALDVEGAALVFQRLAALCGGDEAAALARLAAAELDPLGSGSGPGPGGVEEGGGTRLAQLEGLVARQAARGSHDDKGLDDGGGAGDAWRARHEEARAAVETFSEDDCLLLLRRWLVSLGACDGSLMVSLRRCHSHPHDKSAGAQQLQTGSTAGVLQWGPRGGGSESHVAYWVQVVDMGPKPPSKVLAKAAKEERILALAARPLGLESRGNAGVIM